jgi:hypothetical protein
MLISAKRLHGSTVMGTEEDVGTLKDLLFRSNRWNVEYLDIDTGKWLPGRRVILPPHVVDSVDHASHLVTVPFRRKQVQEGPPLESDMPVSRQKEAEFARYYAWGAYAASLAPDAISEPSEEESTLRSTKAVSGYRIHATDEEFGYVDDFIIDDEGPEQWPWVIRYFVINVQNWLPGKKLLLSPEWVEKIDWATSRVHVDLTEDMIKGCPEYDPESAVNRRYEEVLYDYYGRPKYWQDVTERVHRS